MRSVLLVLSLGANLAFAVLFVSRPASVPPAFREFFLRHAKDPASVSASTVPAAGSAKNSGGSPLWSTLDTGDLRALVDRLKAAGFPIHAIRAIVQSLVAERYDARLRELSQPDLDAPFWKPSPLPGMDPKRLAEYLRLNRERAALLKELLGNFVYRDDGGLTTAEARRYGTLPPAKIDALARIEADYTDLEREVRVAMNNIVLPEDREKLALLEREKRADLAVLLTPEELAEYDMRSSPITARLRPAMGLFNPTEAEFRTIFAIEQAYNDRVSPTSLATMTPEDRRQFAQNRAAAQYEMEHRLAAALGEQRYADFTRASDRDFQQITQLAAQQNLPPEAAAQAFDLRNRVLQESARIYGDDTMDHAQKLAAFQSLAQNARAQFVATLGPAAGGAYVRMADRWLASIERGAAVTITPSGGTSTRTLPPPNTAPGRGSPGPTLIGNGTVVSPDGGSILIRTSPGN
jgi:hypothetical protein